ncbi:carboxyvinyl-carboxyphosphonate phosphorylmutase (plasmid) [Burkholderia sp. SFA1]|uniref:isocitrate lyase/PEP mutase family protein n=1 Tax=unclassified Caballeronia TaxID=2646786 RepID=UPI001F45DFDE|nr:MULTISPECIES: isocitrate lyase/PEP mutase family protein [unclassified Caballeronia]MCE4545938.1 isocitrate lyase/PEP mutase family protein [Caballeronia sp. PC1]MCE4571940.1 isocitrate lyase/PEP mutase family protein [Caballeronia sp. CLC5]BBQ01291.1 carboxyvinyl-carboxyphosphonate phosphorylmutase [Burkholderia sp. SFA1]
MSVTHENKRQALKARFARKEIVTAPGIFDMVSAKMADSMGFDCLYMTGFGTVASYLGLADAGLATYTDMVNRVTAFCGGTQTPMICDGDTGYGGLLNVAHTVRGYEHAGAAGIQLEDQEFPKKCGHTPGRRVIALEDMVRKIKVAVESRSDSNFQIVARTDARTSLGLDEALRRGEAYAKAGADVLFIESPESVEELEKIGRAFDMPLLVNVVEGGRTPQLPPAELQRLGFSLAIYPASGFLAVAKALKDVYGEILAQKGTEGAADALYSFSGMCELMGFPEVWAFDRAHAD